MARSGVVVRTPNRLGDFILALPAMQALHPDVVAVPQVLAALAAMALPGVQVLPLQHGWRGVVRGARDLRTMQLQRGVLVPGSPSSAIMLALASIPERWGEASGGRGPFLTRHLTPSAEPQHLASHLLEIATGTRPVTPPTPRIHLPAEAVARFRASHPGNRDPVGLFPGASAASRRWPAQRFRELAARLRQGGSDVLVFAGPGEEVRAREAAGDAADVVCDADLPTLAAGLASCSILVTNDTGPMHLAAAVGTPVVAFFGPDLPGRVAPLVAPRRILVHTELPCLGCRRAACPRRGAGTVLPRAEHECLELISVGDALAAVISLREETGRN